MTEPERSIFLRPSPAAAMVKEVRRKKKARICCALVALRIRRTANDRGGGWVKTYPPSAGKIRDSGEGEKEEIRRALPHFFPSTCISSTLRS